MNARSDLDRIARINWQPLANDDWPTDGWPVVQAALRGQITKLKRRVRAMEGD